MTNFQFNDNSPLCALEQWNYLFTLYRFNYSGNLNYLLSSRWDMIQRNVISFGCRPNWTIIVEETNQTICDAIINELVNVDVLYDLMLILCWTMTIFYQFIGIRNTVCKLTLRFLFLTSFTTSAGSFPIDIDCVTRFTNSSIFSFSSESGSS